jgi:hypothetical protein
MEHPDHKEYKEKKVTLAKKVILDHKEFRVKRVTLVPPAQTE